MGKRTPRLPMGNAGLREARRQLKQRDQLKARVAKKKKKNAKP